MDLKKILLEANQFSEEIKSVFINEYKKILDEHDLSSKQSLVLNILHKRKKLTMNEIAGIINATPSAASQFIRKLEKQQYVKREVNIDNRREVFVLLDNKGDDFYKELKAVDEMVLEKYFLQLSKEDLLKYHEILKKLHEIVVKQEK
ncbi:MarR family winged helix-turn-helix transcriptional regulator [Lederbergia wuyishanensis]|uniref:DNA-binding MarR family transcriptional regulator n=1 Tax=Lederbergia wuyishanensis TaxID=1347903 RepID=A0ABU0D320_9BACI|nr:MarR family transcriptional regulator [Lederbergia wuyishanensis]MCJ8007054.1 MarR family transcriptional regulator [Lederbergia wuyishanensis]MDQ0342802.1 DNA-binding MarR family transcriptional regulator [Lederbergia wuyishanensis]